MVGHLRANGRATSRFWGRSRAWCSSGAGDSSPWASPEAAFEAGLDFLAPVSLTPRTVPPLLFSLATGRPARNALRGHDLDRIAVRSDRPLPLHADGEDLGDVTDAVFEAERDSITVLV